MNGWAEELERPRAGGLTRSVGATCFALPGEHLVSEADARQTVSKSEAHGEILPGSEGKAGNLPLQEAERSRCAGGRAAWMPREARQAMDGPSRRPPEK